MKTYLKPFIIGFTSTALLIAADGARAQDAPASKRDGVSGTIVAGIATTPDYEGADDQRIVPLAAGEARWGERYLSLDGTTLRANLLNSRTLEFGPAANLTFGRDAEIESLPVRALGVIDDAYEIGAFGAIKTRSLLTEGDEMKLRVEAFRDVSDVHEGWLGGATLSYRLPANDRLSITADASVRFADDDYAATYFSVDAAGSLASGLRTFDAKGGVKDVGVSLTAAYALTDKFSLVGYGGYRRLLGDFEDSPVVSNAGDADQLSAAIGIGLSF